MWDFVQAKINNAQVQCDIDQFTTLMIDNTTCIDVCDNNLHMHTQYTLHGNRIHYERESVDFDD